MADDDDAQSQPAKYPASDLDAPDRLLDALGSLWAGLYRGEDVVRALCGAKLARQQQAFRAGRELVDACDRLQIRPHRQELWLPLTLAESARNAGDYALRKFGEVGLAFEASTSERFGVPVTRPLYAWLLPAEVAALPLLFNRISSPSRTLTEGVDYILQDGFVVFRADPFNDELVPKTSLLQDNVEVDRTVTLWGFRAHIDRSDVYRQFGYVLGFATPTGVDAAAYKDLVNALFDALVLGSTGSVLRAAWSAITGVPLAAGDETVEVVIEETGRKLLVTDKAVYAFAPEANITAVAGDALFAGQAMSDALVFHEFNRGQVPDADTIPALALGRGFLAAGFFGDLVFENKSVPLVVTSDEDGYTKVSWQISGWPGDVESFFDQLHARGRASGQTIAHLLDTRPAAARDTEPAPGALPATINPFAFLCQNVLRNNVLLVRVRASACGPTAVGMHAAALLRRVVQPHTAMLVLAELEYQEAPITMDGPGDATTPGYEEDVNVYLSLAASDTIDPTTMITEEVRCYQVGGHCT